MLRSVIGILPLVFLVGCGSGDSRLEVSGTVNFKSAPVKEGTIQFLPVDKGTGSMLMAVIKDGKYQVPRDKGVLPGKYKVVLSAPAPGGKVVAPDAIPGDPSGFVNKELLPAEYNTASTKTVEIEAGKPNVFDYDIK